MSELEIFAEREALDRVDNDRQLFEELLDLFFQDLPSQLKAMQLASQQRNANSLEKLAHSLKSALGNLGGMRAHAAAQHLELQCKSGNAKNSDMLLQTLLRELNAFRAAVKR